MPGAKTCYRASQDRELLEVADMGRRHEQKRQEWMCMRAAFYLRTCRRGRGTGGSWSEGEAQRSWLSLLPRRL